MSDDKIPDEVRHLIAQFGAELDQIAAALRASGENLEALAKEMHRVGGPAEGSVGSLCPVCGEPFKAGEPICISNVLDKVIHIACSKGEADQHSEGGKDGD